MNAISLSSIETVLGIICVLLLIGFILVKQKEKREREYQRRRQKLKNKIN